jgi:hypothetical protein
VTQRNRSGRETHFVRRRRSVLEFGIKEEKKLLTRPASLEIPRLSGPDGDFARLPRVIAEQIRSRMRYMARSLLAAFLCAAIAFVSCSQPTSMQRVADTEASLLKNRIPPPDANKYRSVRDARDWQNPYLMVRANGIYARPISAATEAPTM